MLSAVVSNAEEPAGASGLEMLANTILIVLVVGSVLVLVLLARKFIEGWGELSGRSAIEESRFESEMLSSAIAAAEAAEGKAGQVEGTPEGPPAGPAGGQSAAAAVPAASSATGPADTDFDAFRQRLEQLRVVSHLEGRVPLTVPPDGIICKMTRGGSCLLLPRLESPDVMDHFLRRFGTVIYRGGGGEPVVVERVQDRLKDLSGL